MRSDVYVFPTSFAQRRLWFLDQLAPRSAFYNIDNAVEISRAVDPALFQRCLNEIIRRHEALRTVFKAIDGEPIQLVLPELTVELPLLDLRSLRAQDRRAESVRLATEEACKPFDLAHAPLLRSSLIQVGDQEFIFLLTMHHIIADGWSIGLFYDELTELYGAWNEEREPTLPMLPIQYPDYATWQKQWMEGPSGQQQLSYWKHQLHDLPTLELPCDYSRPSVQSFRGAVENIVLPRSLYQALQVLSQQENTTLFLTVLAAFVVLLFRYTGKEDIVVGTPTAGRNKSELEQLIGLFLNTLVLRVDAAGDPTFHEMLARVRNVALEAYDHGEVPFDELVRAIRPRRDPARNPLYQVSFQLFTAVSGSPACSEPRFPELFDGDPIPIVKGTSNIDFALDFWDNGDGLSGKIEYSTDLFSADTVRRVANHLIHLLEAAALNPNQRISELSVMPESELSYRIGEWNGTSVPCPTNALLHSLFERQVDLNPSETALISGDRRLTYDELNRKANQVARYLQAQGIGCESIVATWLDRTPEAVTTILGVLKAGAAYLPLDSFSPDSRIVSVLRNANVTALVTDLPPERLEQFSSALLVLDWCEIASFDADNLCPPTHQENLAYVIYTSGSGGTPKGVMVSHLSACNHLLWMQSMFPLTSADRVPLKYSLSFDAAVCELFGPLIAGAQVILADPRPHFEMDYLIDLMLQHQVTVIDIVPSMLRVLLEDERFCRCRSLRRVNCGGEVLPAELQARFFEAFDCELNNIYGPTEGTIGATAWTCLPDPPERTVPIGRPAANTQVYVLDRRLQPVPPGVTGEIYIAGVGLARGYRNRPDLTSENFIPNPFSVMPGDRMYRTGDLARYSADGVFEYLGRTDDQVKLRGHRIELGEIENELHRHPLVAACAVVMETREAELSRLVAHVVPNHKPAELWPSLGEYGVYEELLYGAMTHDLHRNNFYRKPIEAAVRSKTVVDIGTGADAILARLCVEAGAERVYAIEVLENAFARAQETVFRLGLEDKIRLIHADSRGATLPELVDVCVSELFGTIASSEGAAEVLADAQRFLKPGGQMIPSRSLTKIAAVSLPPSIRERPQFGEVPRRFVDAVFRKSGHPFDLRVCLKNLANANLVSDTQTFEELDLGADLPNRLTSDVTLTISKNSRVDGFLLWLNLYAGEDCFDVLKVDCNWLPVFFPAFYPGFDARGGDTIRILSYGTRSDKQLPDYRCSGTVYRLGRPLTSFDFQSPHNGAKFRSGPFYEALFSTYDSFDSTPLARSRETRSRVTSGEQIIPALHSFLRMRLPEYMVPSTFILHDSLPLTASGKVDRRALPSATTRQSQLEEFVAPQTPVQERLAEIWCEILDLERVGIRDNFFDLGGHSLIATKLVSRFRDIFQVEFPLRVLFERPTIAGLAEALEERLIEMINDLSDEQARQLAEEAS
jgi:amino acid adenylation domain-containing protein